MRNYKYFYIMLKVLIILIAVTIVGSATYLLGEQWYWLFKTGFSGASGALLTGPVIVLVIFALKGLGCLNRSLTKMFKRH